VLDKEAAKSEAHVFLVTYQNYKVVSIALLVALQELDVDSMVCRLRLNHMKATLHVHDIVYLEITQIKQQTLFYLDQVIQRN